MTPAGAASQGNTLTDQTQTAVTAAGAAHPAALGVPAGNTTIASAAVGLAWGKPAASAQVLATLTSDATRATVFTYDSGVVMSSGVAAAKRASWLFDSGTGSNLNGTAASLFDAVIRWAAGTVPTVTYTRDAADSIVERKVNGVSTARYSGPFSLDGAGVVTDI
jgi:hypothetical protein